MQNSPSTSTWGERLRAYFFLDHRPGRNVAMEGLRGYAVLTVIMVHVLFSVLHMQGLADCWDYSPFGETAKKYGVKVAVLLGLSFSHYAVDLFFLLSAFLITRIVQRQPGQFHYVDYVRKRFWRIYPTFVVTLAFAVLVQAFIVGWVPFRWPDLFKNLLFLNGLPLFQKRMLIYNVPSWSLFYEFSFYLTFPAAVALWRRSAEPAGTRSFLGSALLMAFAVFACAHMPRAAIFMFGCMIGAHSDQDLRKIAQSLPAWLVVLVYTAVTMAHRYYSKAEGWFVPAYAVAASLLMVKTCFGEGALNRLFSLLPFRFIGNISYSLYLVHATLLTLIEIYLRPRDWGMGPVTETVALFGVTLAVSVPASVVLFALVERRYFAKKKPPAKAAAPEPAPLRVAA